ncbi:hypothetical protein [Providencia stuartii]|uniref:hypothetical protein n=1 Tax=Providencia stuartii TaxID=588 RepID=UPI0018C6A3D0|nr:hypothetical protein [Providencia stuartii]MBG5919478.1 hypothetical protein [Providencia stuartii]
MYDALDPKRNPEQAALQVVIELIRAERIGAQSDGQRVIKIFDDLNAHFKTLSALPPVDFEPDESPF